MDKFPKVGVAVIVINKENKILFHIRKNALGDGTWSLPGGHLEFNEELEECARRETFEEAGISIKNIRFSALTNDIFSQEDKHYITIFMIAEHEFGHPVIKEPEKCDGWVWLSWNNLPRPLFLPIEHLLKRGYCPQI